MRPFSKKSDLETMNKWLAGHDMAPMSADCLPLAGVIEEGVACGFLYQTDSVVAFLENFISNPDASPREVSDAIDAITAALSVMAAEMGIERLIVLSKRASIVRRAEKQGFESKGLHWAMLSKEVH